MSLLNIAIVLPKDSGWNSVNVNSRVVLARHCLRRVLDFKHFPA